MSEERIRRGDVYWADVPYSNRQGHKSRPVVIISNDYTNISNSDVTIVPVSAHCKHIHLRTNVLLPLTDCLSSAAVAKCQDVVTISKKFLHEKAGHLSPADIERVDIGVALALGFVGPDGLKVKSTITRGYKGSALIDAYRMVARDLARCS